MHRPRILLIAMMLCLAFGAAPQTAAYTAESYFEYLKSTYNQHEKKLLDFMVVELKTFMQLFPESELVPEASYILAQVYKEQGEEHQSLAALVKTIILYPDSDIRSSAAEAAHKIVSESRAYADNLEFLTATIDGPSAGADQVDRHFQYLVFLHDLNQPKLYEWTIAELAGFVADHKSDPRTEELLRWIAETYAADGEARAAVASYSKYEHLYPASEHLPFVRFSRGDLLFRQVKDYGRAMEVFTAVLAEYPTSDYAALALYSRAELRAEQNKDYDGALADYRLLATQNPDHEKAVDALLEIASINSGKLKAYETAIGTYDEIIRGYPTDQRAVQALEESAKLSATKMQDYLDAAERYGRIGTMFPNYEESPKMLFKAATMCEGKLKDYQKAVEYYRIIAEQYPDSEHSRKAQQKIEKAQEKLGG